MLTKIKEALIGPAAIPSWIQLAKTQLGVKEILHGENPQIIAYHATTTLKATKDEVAWCSDFVNWVMMKCHMQRTHSAAARSWLGYGPKLGYKKYAIVVFKRGNSAWQGHVGFAVEDLGKEIKVLGGNQHNSVCYSNFKKSDVLGYYWPKPEAGVIQS